MIKLSIAQRNVPRRIQDASSLVFIFKQDMESDQIVEGNEDLRGMAAQIPLLTGQVVKCIPIACMCVVI